MRIKPPAKICVLDLETEETKFKNPEESKLALVGVQVLTFHDGRYHSCKYRCFLPHQIEELERFLRSFPGIIIGHNILGFDYRVLRPLISLDGVVEKTVDTLAFLYRKNGNQFGGLSLGNLSKVNFGKGKTLDGKSVSQLWREGKRKKVIDYNKNDCILTKKLWWHLLKKQTVRVKYSVPVKLSYDLDAIERQWLPIDEFLRVSRHDISALIGKRPLFTFRAWIRKIEKDNYILEKKGGRYLELEGGIGWEPEIAFMYHWFYCDKCKKTFLFQAKIQPGCAEYGMVSCPKCAKQFGEVRADLGYTLIAEESSNLGNGVSQGTVPAPFHGAVVQHIESTRSEWEHPFQKLISAKAKRCGICGRQFDSAEESHANPADGSPICLECLTAARWLLSLK